MCGLALDTWKADAAKAKIDAAALAPYRTARAFKSAMCSEMSRICFNMSRICVDGRMSFGALVLLEFRHANSQRCSS
jgi:hypothetical protein